MEGSAELIAEHRRSLTIGLVLMVINRLAGLVLPWTSKFLIDDIVGKHRAELLMPLAAAAAWRNDHPGRQRRSPSRKS